MDTHDIDQKYSNFLDFSLTTFEQNLVQNKDKPLSIEEVRQCFPNEPIIVRVIGGYAVILVSAGAVMIADFTSFLGTTTVNLFFRGKQTLFEKNQLLMKVREHVYGVASVPA